MLKASEVAASLNYAVLYAWRGFDCGKVTLAVVLSYYIVSTSRYHWDDSKQKRRERYSNAVRESPKTAGMSLEVSKNFRLSLHHPIPDTVAVFGLLHIPSK